MVRIAHIEKVKTFESSFIDVYATVTSEGKFKGEKFDIGILASSRDLHPKFDEEYVEEIPSSAGK
jgi:hypothetical protein